MKYDIIDLREKREEGEEMDELVKTTDPNFEYERHEVDGNVMRLHVHSTRKEAVCPYCGAASKRVHSVYIRKFRDLPIQGKKAEIIIKNRKYFCSNPNCGQKTFPEMGLRFCK
jgi:transposase